MTSSTSSILIQLRLLPSILIFLQPRLGNDAEHRDFETGREQVDFRRLTFFARKKYKMGLPLNN